jgi:hypothetical protein
MKLANPRFFAPGPRDDPRDGLSRMFASSFNISPSPDDEADRLAVRGTHSRNANSESMRSRKLGRAVELVVLLSAFYGWIHAISTEEIYGSTLALASLCACLAVSIRLGADLLVDAQTNIGEGSLLRGPSLAHVGLAQILGTLALMWSVFSAGNTGAIASGVYGNTLFGITILHQFWHTMV